MTEPDPEEDLGENLTYEERQVIAIQRRNLRNLAIAIAAVLVAGTIFVLDGLNLLPSFNFGSDSKPVVVDATPPPDFTPSPFLTTEDKNLKTLHKEIARQAALLRNSYDSSSDKASLTAVEFLTASTLDERLSWVRQPERVAPLMREYYSRGDMHPEFKNIVGRANLTVGGREVVTVSFRSLRKDNLAIALLRDGEDQRFLVDWESFVAYSDMPAEAFLEQKPTTPTTFRLYANLGDYYNFQFSDQSKYQCVTLEDRDHSFLLYGYVPRDQPWLEQIFPSLEPAEEPRPLTLKISFPSAPPADNIVVIDEFVTAWWFAP